MKIDALIEQLSDETKNKIIEKQNSICVSDIEDITLRLKDEQYIQYLYDQLTHAEKSILHVFLLDKNHESIEQTLLKKRIQFMQQSQRSLSILSLRQKGLLYVENRDKNEVYYYLPEEVYLFLAKGEMSKFSFFEGLEVEEGMSTKKLLYLFIDYLNGFEKGSIKLLKNGDLNQQHIKKWTWKHKSLLEKGEEYSEVIVILLSQFLLHEKIIIKEKQSFVFRTDTFEKLLKDDFEKLEDRFIAFLVKQKLDNPYIVHILVHTLTTKENKRLKLSALQAFVLSPPFGKAETWEKINDIFEILILLDLFEELEMNHKKYGQRKRSTNNENLKAYAQGAFDVLIPAASHSKLLWELSQWSTIESWDIMAHFSFNQDQVKFALKQKKDFNSLIPLLEEKLPAPAFEKLASQLEEWGEKNQPIRKRTNITYYPIRQSRVKVFVEQNWSKDHWIKIVGDGIFIEKDYETLLEQLLEKEGIQTEHMNQSNYYPQIEQKVIKLEDRFPELVEAFPGLERLPKQWFSLTSYEERTKVLLIKQAILLQVPILYTKDNVKERLWIEPKQVDINQGEYGVVDYRNNRVKVSLMKTICIANPTEIIEMNTAQ